jgi:ATP-dependent helicase/nuclease subunit A
MSKIIAFPSAENSEKISDEPARAEALDTRRSFIVEAPAGSGKTSLLVQRFLKLLADEEVLAPEEVLAVTFTRKATAELRERVLSQLQNAHENKALSADAPATDHVTRTLALNALSHSQQLNWQILDQPARLNIQTFDAVSMQIANALPLLSGSGGQRQPIDNAKPLYQLASHRTILQLGGSDASLHDALHTILLHRDANLADTERLIAQMLATREQWGSLIPLSRPTLDDDFLDTEIRPRLEHALESIVCSGLSRALNAMPAGVLAELTTFAHYHSQELGYNDAENPLSLCANKNTPPEAVAEHLEHWTALLGLLFTGSGGWRASFNINQIGFALSKTDKALLKNLIDEMKSDALQEILCDVLALPPAKYPDDQWQVTKALLRVLRHALAELKLLFAARGECDFSELALAAREALTQDASASALALAPGGHLRHLLIDEMQDTSAGQYELVHLLTQSWDGHSQTIFLVGDPKQSIYLFRAARVERFLRTMREARLGDLPLTPLHLTSNFRSQPALVEAFNESFSLLFPQQTSNSNDAVDVPFVHAIAARYSTNSTGTVWHTTVLDKRSSNTACQQAREIRTLIEQRLALPLPSGRAEKPWRIAVLGRTRKHLGPIIAELKAASIAFKAIDLDPLNECPEVLDVLALTRALLHPADRVAWLAVLHAPWCGLGLADLLAIAGSDRTSTLAALVAVNYAALSPTAQQLIDRAWPTLEAAIATLGTTPLSTHVERTWRSLGGDAALSTTQQTNILRFLGILRDLEVDSGRVDLSNLTARLDSLYAEPAVGTPPVELLTIHKAKGLEWDLVIVPSLEGGSGNSTHPLLNWLEFDSTNEDDAAILLAPIHGRGEQSSQLSKWLGTLRTRRERAETRRLFYVAATRAQEELHLFATVERNKSSLNHGQPTSLLTACWPAAEAHFLTAMENLSSRPEDSWLHHESVAERPAVGTNDNQVSQGFSLGSHSASWKEGALAPDEQTFALAASAQQAPLIQRLPLTFDPSARFRIAAEHRLPYPDASVLRQSPAFERPEGGFASRAFGNVVHRYMQVLSTRLATSTTAETLLAELTGWRPRLIASLRGEGLAPTLAERESTRVLTALTSALNDPTGLWILSPHASASSERALTTNVQTLRVDRTFFAGDAPNSTVLSGHIWIIDFKTSEQGSRSNVDFEANELAKYGAQMQAYANLRHTLPDGDRPIHLGLYYPLIPRLIHWTSKAK